MIDSYSIFVIIPSLGSAMVMSIYTLTDAIVIGQGVGANALAALASGLMGCNAGGGSFGVRVECSVFEKYKV